MKITIVPPDKVVKVEGVRKKLPDFDWTPFDEIHAVQANIERNRAEIEYRLIDPDGDGPLPATKKPNELIDAVDFQERFGAIIAAFDAAPAPVRRVPLSDPRPASMTHEFTADTGLGARLAALEDSHARLTEKFDILFEEVSKVRPQT